VAFALTLACKDPTQITLGIDTDVACATATSGVRLADVGIAASRSLLADDANLFVTTAAGCESEGRVGSLVLVPAEGRSDDFVEVLVVAGVQTDAAASSANDCEARRAAGTMEGEPCIVVRRRLGFVKSTLLELSVTIEEACIGKPCEADQTCFKGACVEATVDCDGGVCKDPGSGRSSSSPCTPPTSPVPPSSPNVCALCSRSS
jgi:hypothetical protein